MVETLGHTRPFSGLLAWRHQRPRRLIGSHPPLPPIHPPVTAVARIDDLEVDLRTEVLSSIARVQAILNEIHVHEQNCDGCTPVCANWLRNQWAEVHSILDFLPIETISLANGESLTITRN